MNVMVAGVGYTNLRDLSLGPVLVPRLRDLDWPDGIEVDDLSFGPIAVVLRLRDRPDYYQRMVLVSAVERGRAPGGPYCYRWTGELPDPEEIQARVGEAVTGVISVDNLLIVAGYFGALPGEVIVVEVEPEDTGWGPGFTPTIEGILDSTIDTVRRVTLNGYDG
jgi:hydrogenase maturation protease